MSFLENEPVEGAIVGGKYRLINKISEGGGGIVWEAESPQGLRVALKLLKWSPLRSRKHSAERFKNEFAILKSMSHPNIARIYDFGVDPDSDLYFFTSELLQHGDLKTLLKAPIPELEALLLQALRSLEYLNNHKLLHLDIKPQNLMLKNVGKDRYLVLIDFGLATFRPPERPGGTANYMPPELVVLRLNLKDLHFSHPDHRSDLYSLGVTFYYCLTGVQPFAVRSDGNTSIDNMATLKNHLTLDPPPPSVHRPEIPSYLDRIIMKLIARQPDERYPSAIIAAQALQYSSPRKFPTETVQTLLSYLPKEGRLIGRKQEIESIEKCLKDFAGEESSCHNIILIAGKNGTGKSRLLRSIKPIAQQIELETTLIDKDSVSKSLDLNKKSKQVFLIDDLESLLSESRYEDDLAKQLKSCVRGIKISRMLKNSGLANYFLVATLNTDTLNAKAAIGALDVDEKDLVLLELKNFNKEEIGEYLNALLGAKPDAAAVDQIIKYTGGNPFYVTEHLEGMIARGTLFSLAGRPDAKTIKTIGIDFSQDPPSKSLTHSISEHLNVLSKRTRDLALLIACWHRPASADELKATSIDDAIGEDLLNLTSLGIVKQNPSDGRFVFADILSSRIVKSTATRSMLAKCHDRIATYLKNEKKLNKMELVEHIAYGTHSDGTIEALKKLTDTALEEGRKLDAIYHMESIIENTPKGDHSSICENLIAIGNLYEKLFRYDDAKKTYSHIPKLHAPRTVLPELKLVAAEQLGRFEIRRRNLRKAKSIFSNALAITKGKKSLTPWRIKIENFIAGIDLREGRVEAAIEKFERTDSVARKVLSPSERIKISNNDLGEALLRAGRIKDALKILAGELKDAKASSDEEREANRLYLMANALRHEEIRKFEEAKKYYNDALKISKFRHMINLEVRILNGLGNLMLMTQKPKDAIKYYREGLKLSEQVDSYTTSVELMLGMGLAAQSIKDPDDTIEYMEAALDFSSGPKGDAAGLIRRFNPTIYISLGDAYYQKRNFERAIECLEKAKELDDKSHLTPDLRYSLYGTLAEIHLEYDDLKTAASFLPQLTAIAKSFAPARTHLSRLLKKFPAPYKKLTIASK